MARVTLGNHMAAYAARSQQERIRGFYRNVLGCTVRVETAEVDRFQMGDLHLCFVYQDDALDESAFLKTTYLELQTDDMENMIRRILDFGVKTVDLPDPHLYFQAPGGQVFKLVGRDEDLRIYEESASSRPGAATG